MSNKEDRQRLLEARAEFVMDTPVWRARFYDWNGLTVTGTGAEAEALELFVGFFGKDIDKARFKTGEKGIYGPLSRPKWVR